MCQLWWRAHLFHVSQDWQCLWMSQDAVHQIYAAGYLHNVKGILLLVDSDQHHLIFASLCTKDNIRWNIVPVFSSEHLLAKLCKGYTTRQARKNCQIIVYNGHGNIGTSSNCELQYHTALLTASGDLLAKPSDNNSEDTRLQQSSSNICGNLPLYVPCWELHSEAWVPSKDLDDGPVALQHRKKEMWLCELSVNAE